MKEYKLIRSVRKTVSIQIEQDGSVLVRAPLTTDKKFIDGFVASKADWVSKNVDKMKARQENRQELQLDSGQIREFKALAKAYLTERSLHFAEIMGVRYKQLKINSAHTRWGSCNAKGDINYTYRLILAPKELVDYVIVHELAHLSEMNHSKKFWSVVARILPDYKDREKRLNSWQRSMKII